MVLDLLRAAEPTIPLFKLLPGRPSGVFFSSSFFLGGILLLRRGPKVVKWREEVGSKKTDFADSVFSMNVERQAKPVALGWKGQETEAKRQRCLMDGVVLTQLR